MRKLLLCSAAALMLASPALAENGGAADRNTGGISGSQHERSGRDRGSYLTREVAPGIFETTRVPDRFTPRGESGVRGVSARNEAERSKGGLAARQ